MGSFVSSPPPAFSKEFISAGQTITAGGGLTLAHGMGVAARLYGVTLKCTTAEGGYSIGDERDWPFGFGDTNGATTSRGVSLGSDATNLNIRYSTAPTFNVPNKTTGAYFDITPANWQAIFKGWA